MQVDLSPAGVEHDQAGREAGIGLCVVSVPERVQGRLCGRECAVSEDKVKIGVLTRSLAHERVDAPTAIDPCRDSSTLETIERLDYRFRAHHAPSVATGPRGCSAAAAGAPRSSAVP